MAANVLLEIATKTDFASLAALKDMVMGTVGAIGDWIAVNERFVQQMNNATISIGGMEKNVANLIDTGLAYQQTTELTNSGLDATSDQFAAVAKAATVFGKTTGDVNGEFTKLINALKTGRTEGLKKYGIEIEATGDRQADFEKAVEQLTDRFKDHKVELETTQEVMSSLSNNWGTLQGQVLKLTGLNEPLISGFRRLNDELAEASGNLDDMIRAMERYDSIKKRVEDRSDLALADPYGGMDEALSRMRTKRMIEMVARSQDAIDQWQRENVSDFLNERGDYASDISDIMSESAQGAISRMLAAGEFTTSVTAGGKSRRSGWRRRPTGPDRSGGDAAARAMMLDFAEADILRQMAQEEADAAAAELKELNEQIASTQQERMERQEAARIAASDYANAIHEQNLALREQTDIAYQWAMSWEDSFSTFNTGAFAAEMGADFLRGSIEAVVMSIWNGSDNVGQALLKFTQQLLLHGGIQILGEGFVTLARAIGHAATPYTAWMAPKEFVASGVQMAMGTAMVSGAFLTRKMSGAGGKDQAQSGASSAGSSQTYSDGSPTYLSRKQDEQRVNVTITLKDGADGFVSAMYSQNEQRAKRGATHFRTSEGY